MVRNRARSWMLSPRTGLRASMASVCLWVNRKLTMVVLLTVGGGRFWWWVGGTSMNIA